MMDIVATQIEIRNNRSGQPRAYIAGTRVRVLDFYALAELQGLHAEDIADALPHLTLSQIHAALAYYFAHREEIVRELREEDELAEYYRALSGPGPLEAKRAAKGLGRDSVSP